MNMSRRLFVYIILMVLGFATLILLSNSLLLGPIYYWSVKNTMLKAMDDIDDIDYTQDTDIWLAELDDLSAGAAYDVVIRSGDAVIFSSSNEFGLKPRPDISQDDADVQPDDQAGAPMLQYWEGLDTLADGTHIGIVTMQDEKTEMMVCSREINTDVSIVLTQPVEPVDQSVWQANLLLIGCTVLSLGISAVIVLKISKRFTKPIREIQSTVGEMAGLNFDTRCDIKTGDELESLGSDVNVLADTLQAALKTLEKQNEQLEQDIVAQKRFIANASHELRTPLSLIKGYADEMSGGFTQSDMNNTEYVRIIADEAAKMNRLLTEMLELSRMESGTATLHKETLPVGEIVRQFIEKYDGYIAKNGLNIALNLDEDAVGLFDAVRFEQVLANFVSNAARYGDREKQIRIYTQVLKKVIRISVFNTGQAIPEDRIPRLWDGFYKADDSRTHSGEGYGLGLSIVKAIQNAIGQGFGAHNVPGGVEFWFEVPRKTDTAK